jgi:hypothetical protein
MEQSPHDARQKSRIARADFALLLGFANGLLGDCETPAAPFCGAAAF